MLSTAIVRRMTADSFSLFLRLKPVADIPAIPIEAPTAAATISTTLLAHSSNLF